MSVYRNFTIRLSKLTNAQITERSKFDVNFNSHQIMDSPASKADELLDAKMVKALAWEDYPVDEGVWTKLCLHLDIYESALLRLRLFDN